MGLPRPPYRRGRGRSRRRRHRARQRPGRGLDRQRRGNRSAGRWDTPGRVRRDVRGAQRPRGHRTRAARARRYRPGRPRPGAGRSRRHPQPEPARRQRADRSLAGRAARGRRGRRSAAVALPPRRPPCPAPAARDPDLRGRRPRRTPGRHPGLHGDAGRGDDVRGGPRVDGRGVSGRRRAHGAGRPAAGASPTRAATGRRSIPTRRRWRSWSGPSRTPAAGPATISPSRSTSPPRSSTTRDATS